MWSGSGRLRLDSDGCGLFVLEDLESAVGFHAVFAEIQSADLFFIRCSQYPEFPEQQEDDQRAEERRRTDCKDSDDLGEQSEIRTENADRKRPEEIGRAHV